MIISVLEIQRARKVLDEFCARRNALSSATAAHLCCRQQAGKLFIGESTLVEKTNDSGRFRALVRISYEDGRWYLSWPQHSGAWRPFPHLPRADTIQAVVEAFEQAPLHVHWG